MSKNETNENSSFWHWYWVDSGRLEGLLFVLLISSPVLIGILLDILFPAYKTFYPLYTSIGGIILFIALLAFSFYDYIIIKKSEYNMHLRRNKNGPV